MKFEFKKSDFETVRRMSLRESIGTKQSLVAFLLLAFLLAACSDFGDRDNPLDPGADNYVAQIDDPDEVSSSSISDDKDAEGSSSSVAVTNPDLSSDSHEGSSSSVNVVDDESSSSGETPSVNSSSSNGENASSSSSKDVDPDEKSSSSVDTWTCGDSTVIRGDQAYKTILLGEQCWTQENMNFEPSSGMTLCYGDNASNCKKYGRLYNYEAANAVCPSGWRLPTAEEYEAIAELTLAKAETVEDDAGRHLKAASGWTGENGDDNIGFTALPGGKCDEDQECAKLGSLGYWWSSTAVGKYAHKTLSLTGDNDGFTSSFGLENESFASVRCVKK